MEAFYCWNKNKKRINIIHSEIIIQPDKLLQLQCECVYPRIP